MGDLGLSFAKVPIGAEVRAVTFSPKAFENRENFAVAVAKIVSTSSLIESVLGGILGSLMHADHRAAIALLKKQNNSSQRIHLVEEVAKVTLVDKEAEDLKALLKRINSYSKQRNDIVHGLWGKCDDEPDLMFWLKSDELPTISMSPVYDLQNGNIMKTLDEVTARIKQYHITDLQDIETESSKVLEEAFRYYTSSLATYAARKATGMDNLTIRLNQSD